MDTSNKTPLFYLISFLAILFWSAMDPHDRFTWVLEVLPAIIGLIVLLFTYKKFRLTGLAYGLIWIHAIILMVGGHYTYAQVPLFDWIKDMWGLERNNYDKLGHFAQGFVPAIIAREILIRQKVVNGAKWRSFIIVCICLAISAFYELIEWLVAELSGTAAEDFLGTQGYVWDTQTDMALALAGAVLALLSLGRLHDKQLARLEQRGQAL